MNELEVRNLNIAFINKKNRIDIIENLNLDIPKEKIVSIIGESGCGKSVLIQGMLKLLAPNALVDGTIKYNGLDLNKLTDRELRSIRGKEIGFIMQNPSEALNALLTNGKQIEKVISLDNKYKSTELNNKVLELLKKVDLYGVRNILKMYPHQLSGGMKQRLLTSIGMARNPKILIADEPTKGLDLIIRNQIGAMLYNLAKNEKKTILFVTHDVKLAKYISDRVVVMYSGQIVEEADTNVLFRNPKHPYFNGLLNSLPENGLNGIPGKPTPITEKTEGCKFYPRCEKKLKICKYKCPELKDIGLNHKVRCHLFC